MLKKIFRDQFQVLRRFVLAAEFPPKDQPATAPVLDAVQDEKIFLARDLLVSAAHRLLDAVHFQQNAETDFLRSQFLAPEIAGGSGFFRAWEKVEFL